MSDLHEQPEDDTANTGEATSLQISISESAFTRPSKLKIVISVLTLLATLTVIVLRHALHAENYPLEGSFDTFEAAYPAWFIVATVAVFLVIAAGLIFWPFTTAAYVYLGYFCLCLSALLMPIGAVPAFILAVLALVAADYVLGWWTVTKTATVIIPAKS